MRSVAGRFAAGARRRLLGANELPREAAAPQASALLERMWATSAWIRQADVPQDVLVSVITATRNRAQLLPRAVESVLAQSHENWELLLVDNGSTDATQEVIAGFTDPRIRTLRTDHPRVSGPRNRGLQEALGAVVTYLDDDNRMHPDWLRSVVWAMSRWPEARTLYGARVVEDSRPYRDVAHEMPLLLLDEFDRTRLEEEMNFIDVNVLAHRAGLPEATFDEELEFCADWDLALRLTTDQPALQLPVLAVLYATSAAGRLSDDLSGLFREAAQVRERARVARDAST